MLPEKLTEETGSGAGRKNHEGKRLLAFTLFVKLIIDPVYYRQRWGMWNFRYRFLLRTLLVWPRVTFRYLQALCELDDLERLLEANPVLPAKPHRPYLHRGGQCTSAGSGGAGALSFCSGVAGHGQTPPTDLPGNTTGASGRKRGRITQYHLHALWI